ncbi:MAG: lamin tail domain-containing protein [Patescibacteria group bacterium]|nr:lamin tail domain-containing protein [Patescibacteria group bacterium]
MKLKIKNKDLLLIVLIFIVLGFSFAQQKPKFRPNRNIETIIQSAPPSIIETNQVTFKFSGVNFRKQDDKLRFQTKLWPLEKGWQDNYSNEKTYSNLPKGKNVYLFYVRAVNEKNEYDPFPAVYVFETRISPFYKDVSIGTSYDGMSLTLYNDSDREINITGWKISTSKLVFTIPQGVKNFTYDINKIKLEDIVLSARGRAIIQAVYSSATSGPIGSDWRNLPLSPYGFNFLPNKCFLYVNKNFNDHYACDYLSISREELLQMVLNGRISSDCAVLLSSSDCDGSWLIRRTIERGDLRCQAIVEQWYNYNSCYQRKSADSDFFSKIWRIYFDPRNEDDKKNRKPIERFFRDRFEKIMLLDQNNLLVNSYEIY